MTQAVSTLLIFFSLLLIFYLIAIVVLTLQRIRANQLKLISANTLLIVYATQSGQSEHLATQTAAQLAEAGEQVQLLNIEKLSTQQLQTAKRVIWVVSTYGEGDAPDQAQHFDHHILKQNLDLAHQSYAVLALGDRRYANFCEFGHRLNQMLQQHKATPWFDLVTVDQHSQDDLLHWNNLLAQQFQHDFALSTPVREWHAIQLKSRHLLNQGSQGNALYHLCFAVSPTMTWQSGDIVEIQCENSNQILQDFQVKFPDLNAIQIEQLRDRNLRDIPAQLPQQQTAEWLEGFKQLPVREYSIASIESEGQLDLVVRQEIDGAELGLGSGLLTQGLKLGQSIHAYVRCNQSFHLCKEARPAIFIGNGSGIAGLLAHLKQRIDDVQYQNWLIYGERQSAFDHVFSEDLETWQRLGQITTINRVFSRDKSSEKYVQDVLRKHANEFKHWVEQGACIYLCGSLNMAQGIDDALVEILGAKQINALRKAGHYRRDVY